MNEFNYADKIGQEKAIIILKKLFNEFQYEQHLDNSRSDIEMTARTQTYTIECKDRHYNKNFLIDKGAMIEISKYESLKEHRKNEKFIYLNTCYNGYVVYDLTNSNKDEFKVEWIKRPIEYLHPEKGNKTIPCYIIPKKYIVNVG